MLLLPLLSMEYSMPLSRDVLIHSSIQCTHPLEQLAAFARTTEIKRFQYVLRVIFGASSTADFTKLHDDLRGERLNNPRYRIVSELSAGARYDQSSQTIEVSAAAVEQALSQASSSFPFLVDLLQSFAHYVADFAQLNVADDSWPEVAKNYVGTLALFDRQTKAGTVIAVIDADGSTETITLALPSATAATSTKSEDE